MPGASPLPSTGRRAGAAWAERGALRACFTRVRLTDLVRFIVRKHIQGTT
jgi:hypothetical protein